MGIWGVNRWNRAAESPDTRCARPDAAKSGQGAGREYPIAAGINR